MNKFNSKKLIVLFIQMKFRKQLNVSNIIKQIFPFLYFLAKYKDVRKNRLSICNETSSIINK